MKTFKRPMFRRGGSTNEGVMNGMVDRENFAVKGIDDATMEKIRARENLFRSITAPRGSDSLSNLLISGGLNLISGEGAGDGELAGIARAFRKPTQQFFKEESAEKQFGRQLGLAAATGVLGQKDKIDLARVKARNTMQKERRIALALLNKEGITNPSEEQILNKIAEYATQTQTRFDESMKAKQITEILQNPLIRDEQQALAVYDFRKNILPKLPRNKIDISDYIFRGTDKKTNKPKQKDGIYIDPSGPIGGRIVEIIEGKVTDVTDQYRK